MEQLRQHIEKQFMQNRNKNLFYKGLDHAMEFIRHTPGLMDSLRQLQGRQKELLLEYITNRAIEEFYRVNQYYSFSENQRAKLLQLYRELYDRLLLPDEDPREIAGLHYLKLRNWLCNSNPFAEKMYRNGSESVEEVPCFEFSIEMQLELFGLDPKNLMQPVLDIGCGKTGALVAWFNSHHIEACGIDRLCGDLPHCSKSDWMEYGYGEQKWGTVISHLGFSNHFYHHHRRTDGLFREYALKYMEILNALKPAGSFYYAPSLPFIETFLQPEKFERVNFSTGIENMDVSRIIRIK